MRFIVYNDDSKKRKGILKMEFIRIEDEIFFLNDLRYVGMRYLPASPRLVSLQFIYAGKNTINSNPMDIEDAEKVFQLLENMAKNKS